MLYCRNSLHPCFFVWGSCNLLNYKAMHNIVHTSLRNIRSVVSFEFNIPPDDIDIPRRWARVVSARQVCHYMARKYTNATLAEIASEFGGMDHATCLHSARTVENLVHTDKFFQQRIQNLEMYFTYDFNSMAQL